MIDKAAFAATFSDLRLIKTRRVVQFCFEVPVEASTAALSILGGMPNGGEERWFAIAPLVQQPTTPKENKGVHRLVQRAGILCNDPEFMAFAIKENKQEPKELIYRYCNISSRRELATNESAQMLFEKLLGKFEAWRRGIE